MGIGNSMNKEKTFTIMFFVVMAIILGLLITSCGAKKPFLSASLLKADIKAADKITAVEDLGELKAEATAEVKAVDLSNKTEQKVEAGRDSVINTTNDSGLLKYIFHGYSALSTMIITGLLALLRQKNKQIEANEIREDKFMGEMFKSNTKLVEKLIEAVIKTKGGRA